MKLLSSSNWFCLITATLLGAMLTWKTLAFQCRQCRLDETACPLWECEANILNWEGRPIASVCASLYNDDDTNVGAFCSSVKAMDELIGGVDKCAAVKGRKIIEKIETRGRNRYRIDMKKTYTLCSCSTDSCNYDDRQYLEADAKLMMKSNSGNLLRSRGDIILGVICFALLAGQVGGGAR